MRAGGSEGAGEEVRRSEAGSARVHLSVRWALPGERRHGVGGEEAEPQGEPVLPRLALRRGKGRGLLGAPQPRLLPCAGGAVTGR